MDPKSASQSQVTNQIPMDGSVDQSDTHRWFCWRCVWRIIVVTMLTFLSIYLHLYQLRIELWFLYSDVMTTNYGKITSPQIHHKEENVSLCVKHYPIQWRKETETLLIWVIVPVIYNFDDLGSESCDIRFMRQFEAINTTIALCGKYAFGN